MKVWVGMTAPMGRKAAKKKGKEKANNTVVRLVTSHFKKFGTNDIEKAQIVEDSMTILGEKATTTKDVIRIRDDEKQH